MWKMVLCWKEGIRMYVHIGNGISINEKDIIAIFNINSMLDENQYQKVFGESERKDISKGNAKSLILITKGDKIVTYISHIQSSTIKKRGYQLMVR